MRKPDLPWEIWVGSFIRFRKEGTIFQSFLCLMCRSGFLTPVNTWIFSWLFLRAVMLCFPQKIWIHPKREGHQGWGSQLQGWKFLPLPLTLSHTIVKMLPCLHKNFPPTFTTFWVTFSWNPFVLSGKDSSKFFLKPFVFSRETSGIYGISERDRDQVNTLQNASLMHLPPENQVQNNLL